MANMVSIEEIRKTLPPECKDWSDERVKKLSDQMDRLADVLFDMWLAERNKKKPTVPLRGDRDGGVGVSQ